MTMYRIILSICGLCLCLAGQVAQADSLFNVQQRRTLLQQPEYADAKAACMAASITLPVQDVLPVKGLSSTEEYGSDKSGQEFAWQVMVLSGRALVGDLPSTDRLKRLLLQWAEAEAFEESDTAHDTYYALKRTMLPVVAAYSIVRDALGEAERTRVSGWIDRIVRKLDKKFDGDVDRNNHRYLADSVLMAWGAETGDELLFDKGVERYIEALGQMRADGSLPLETRRGARALWYIRQSLADLAVIAETASLQGIDLYAESQDDKSYADLLAFFLNGVKNPLLVYPYAGENYIPGPQDDPMKQDMDMLDTRPHGRHYMGFAEAYLARHQEGLTDRRFRQLMERTGFEERPLIDEYVGGNATCFWWNPDPAVSPNIRQE